MCKFKSFIGATAITLLGTAAAVALVAGLVYLARIAYVLWFLTRSDIPLW